jgi:mRNA interferase RelE/StbE
LKTDFKKSFTKDLKKIREQDLKKRVATAIKRAEEAKSLRKVENIRKLRGSDRYYRIKIGDYRIGLKLKDNMLIFIRFLHRRDIYKYFP